MMAVAGIELCNTDFHLDGLGACSLLFCQLSGLQRFRLQMFFKHVLVNASAILCPLIPCACQACRLQVTKSMALHGLLWNLRKRPLYQGSALQWMQPPTLINSPLADITHTKTDHNMSALVDNNRTFAESDQLRVHWVPWLVCCTCEVGCLLAQ